MRGPTGTRQPGVGGGGPQIAAPPSPAPPGVPSSCGGVSGPAAGASLPNSVREQPRARAPCPLPTAPKAPRLQKESSRTSPSPGPAWVMALRMRLYRLLLHYFFFFKKNVPFKESFEIRRGAAGGSRVPRRNPEPEFIGLTRAAATSGKSGLGGQRREICRRRLASGSRPPPPGSARLHRAARPGAEGIWHPHGLLLSPAPALS